MQKQCNKCKYSCYFDDSKTADTVLQVKCPRCGNMINLNEESSTLYNQNSSLYTSERNPIVNGIYSGAISGFIFAIPITLLALFNIGSYYTAYSITSALLMPFLKTVYLGISIGACLALIKAITDIEVWATLGVLIGTLVGLLIGLITGSLICWTIKLTLLSALIVFIKGQTFLSYQEGSLSTPLIKDQKVILAILLSFTLIPIGLGLNEHCKYSAKVPFFDGLFLDYGDKYGDLFKVSIADDMRLKITKTGKSDVFKGSATEYIVNEYGKIEKETRISMSGKIKEKSRNIGEFSSIWLPTNSLSVGDMLPDKRLYVARKDKWRQWEVFVIKDSIISGGEMYYELHTGYLVWIFYCELYFG